MNLVLGLFFSLTLAAPTFAAGTHAHPEKHYQQQWCTEHAGQAEVRLPDGTRADCITGSHAVEFDFGAKWAEAIGQTLYYSLQTGKRAGIVLILEDEGDYRY